MTVGGGDRRRVQAVVFDMDGVIIDSEPVWQRVREDFAARHGRTWSTADQLSTMGCNSASWARIMLQRLDLGDAGFDEAGIVRAIVDGMGAAYARRLPLRVGAVDAVRRVAAHSRVALASGSPRVLGEIVLRASGLEGLFEATLFGEDVARGKPAPDIYHQALQRLGVPAAAAVGVEDSGNGILALHAAGMAIVAAPQPDFALAPEAAALAGATIRSMHELDAAVIARAAAAR